MTLPKISVKEVHYWAVVIHDQFRPEGEEYPTRFETQEDAEAIAQRFVDKDLATRKE